MGPCCCNSTSLLLTAHPTWVMAPGVAVSLNTVVGNDRSEVLVAFKKPSFSDRRLLLCRDRVQTVSKPPTAQVSRSLANECVQQVLVDVGPAPGVLAVTGETAPWASGLFGTVSWSTSTFVKGKDELQSKTKTKVSGNGSRGPRGRRAWTSLPEPARALDSDGEKPGLPRQVPGAGRTGSPEGPRE